MSETKQFGTFSREFKIALLARLEGGERLTAVAEEAGIRRKLLYEWRDAVRGRRAPHHRSSGLNERGRAREKLERYIPNILLHERP